jgi:hypothetical protein
MKMKKVLKRKTEKFSQIPGILNNAFKPILVHKSSRTKASNALYLPILLHGNENWPSGKSNTKRLTSIEMKFFRKNSET